MDTNNNQQSNNYSQKPGVLNGGSGKVEKDSQQYEVPSTASAKLGTNQGEQSYSDGLDLHAQQMNNLQSQQSSQSIKGTTTTRSYIQSEQYINTPQAEQLGTAPPTDSESMLSITKVHYSGGEITEMLLSNGQRVSYAEAIQMTQDGQIAGVNVGQTRGIGSNSHPVLRGNADGDPSNNLANLPRY